MSEDTQTQVEETQQEVPHQQETTESESVETEETVTDVTQKSSENSSSSAGRPLSEKGREAKEAVEQYVLKNESFTANDVENHTGLEKVFVRNRLNALERKGVIHKNGTVPNEGRGRPCALYERSK